MRRGQSAGTIIKETNFISRTMLEMGIGNLTRGQRLAGMLAEFLRSDGTKRESSFDPPGALTEVYEAIWGKRCMER